MDIRLSGSVVPSRGAFHRWLTAAREAGLEVEVNKHIRLVSQGVGVVIYKGQQYVIDYLPHYDGGTHFPPQELRARDLLPEDWQT